ncbi:MAG TPA: hypothetical protein VLL97_01760, partial [Acidobacteriota bacterium]|nr:hypothetical protein [Acidobacteriota bacterium]
MARIRTIKPEMMRHEELQDLEMESPELRPMLVFIGLLMVADKSGRFEWKPQSLKLDILPFVDYDIAKTLDLLCRHRFIRPYEVDGKLYGLIPTFTQHQRITGKEAQTANRFPDPENGRLLEEPGEIPGKHP